MKTVLETERGFRDILSPEADSMERLVDSARTVFEAYDYRPIILPVVEPTELFVRSVGSGTDIVDKEMFYVNDGHGTSSSNGRELCLRPEGTASAVRAYIHQGFHMSQPVQRLYYTGPMFRSERPQKGRFRQFYQVGAEMFGVANARADVEVIAMLMSFLRNILPLGAAQLFINSLGCPDCRPTYLRALRSYLEAQMGSLCEDCRRRLRENPLRVLDCKRVGCLPIVRSSPMIAQSWCPNCRAHHQAVMRNLDMVGVSFANDTQLVRGLDYYTRTVFEVKSDQLGSQNAVAAGGRYDGLVESLGGPPTPALGFAVGVDRLAMVLSAKPDHSGLRLYVAATSDAMRSKAMDLAERIRHELTVAGATVRVRTDLEDRKLKRQLEEAQTLGCQYTIIVGDQEDQDGKVILKNMSTSTQETIGRDNLVPTLRSFAAAE